MILINKKELRENIKLEIIPALKQCNDIKQIKPLLEDKARDVLLPEGNPESRIKKIEKNIQEIKNNAEINHIVSAHFLKSLEKESSICIKLPYRYSDPNISSAEASHNRSYGFVFGELLEVIKNNPQYVKSLQEAI